MAGLIELQQGLSYSSTVEKVQQVKQDNLTVHQQLAASEMKEKNALKQREVHQTDKTDDIRIRDMKKRQEKKNKDKKKRSNLITKPDAQSRNPEHAVDIIV